MVPQLRRDRESFLFVSCETRSPEPLALNTQRVVRGYATRRAGPSSNGSYRADALTTSRIAILQRRRSARFGRASSVGHVGTVSAYLRPGSIEDTIE